MHIWTLYKQKNKALKSLDKFVSAIGNSKRKLTGQEPRLTRKQKIRNALSRVYPPLKGPAFAPRNRYERMFAAGTRENALFSLFRNIVFLEIFGMVMYLVFALKYATDLAKTGTIVSIGIHMVLTLMFIFPSLMYYLMLSVHRMTTSKLRTLILLIILSMAFEYPAMNALTNIHKVAEGIACIQEDVEESTVAVMENIADKGQMAVAVMNKMLAKIAPPINFFKGMLRKLDDHMTRLVEVTKRTWQTIAGITNECKRIMMGPYNTCRNTLHNAYLYCWSKDLLISMGACHKIEIATKICETAKEVAESACNFPATVGNGLKDGAVPYYFQFWKLVYKGVKKALYFHIKAAKMAIEKGKLIKKELVKAKNIRIKTVKFDEKMDATLVILKESVKETVRGIMETYKNTIRLLMAIIHWALVPALMIWPFISTALFLYRFNYREEYRNVYITDEFERIDLDCALRGQTKVLPLSNKEKLKYCNRMAWKASAEEHKSFVYAVGLTLLIGSSAFVFIFLDLSTYFVLSRVYAIFSVTQLEFPTHYEVKVSGNGSAANLMNSLLETFSPVTNGAREREMRWRNCFNEPNPPDGVVYMAMFLLFTICLILCRLSVWLSRQSLALADYFYPHRVRPRALFLYNKLLFDRKHMLGAIEKAQQSALAEDQLAGRETLVRKGLQSRGFVRTLCVVCKKPDLRLADQANTRLCVHCGAFYCTDCFCMTENCVDCEKFMQLVDGFELYYEALSDDEESEPTISENDDMTSSAATSESKDETNKSEGVEKPSKTENKQNV